MIFRFIKTNILSKKLRSFLTIFSIAISIILIISIQNITQQLSSNIKENAGYYDIIVGAPGSETQLVLSTIFYYDSPIANIDISYLEKLEQDNRIQNVVPIGMGDNYNGYRLIGTKTNFFDALYKNRKIYNLKEGTFFNDDGEVVLGSTVAKVTGLKVGDTFVSSHGLTENGSQEEEHHHEALLYKVVGILEPTKTPNDTVIFTDIENLWHVHGMHYDENDEHEEHSEDESAKISSHSIKKDELYDNDSTNLITAILVRSKGLSEQYLISNELKKDSNIQVINPTETLRKLLNTLDVGTIIVTIVAYIAITLSCIMLFTTMLSSSLEKMKDISILRALGANRKTVFGIILLESIVLALLGTVIGVIVSHIGIGILGSYTAAQYGLEVSGTYFATGEATGILVLIVLSLIAGIIPGIMAYQADATKYIK